MQMNSFRAILLALTWKHRFSHLVRLAPNTIAANSNQYTTDGLKRTTYFSGLFFLLS